MVLLMKLSFCLCTTLFIIGWHSIPSSGALIEFVPGRSYEYLYQTQVKLDDKSRHQQTNEHKASGYKAYTKFKVASIWSSENLHEHIIKLSASDKPHGNLPPQDKHFESILKSPSYFHWNNGLVQYIYTLVTPSGELNMLKSLIDTFQLHSVLETQKFIQFADIRGQCNVTLSMDDNNELTANKTCINRSYLQRSTSYYPLDVEVTSHSSGHYEFTDDKLVKRFVAEEVQNVSPVIRAFQSAVVTARQEITLEGYADDEIVLTDTFDSIILEFESKMNEKTTLRNFIDDDIMEDTEECIDLAQFVKKLRKGFKKVGTIENSRSFIKLVKCFREANNETIVEAVLKMKKHFAYYKILLDAVCVAQTFSSYKALMTLVDFKDESNILLEKILFSLSLATYPPEEYIAFLLDLIKHPFKDSRLYEAALNTLGALLHTMKKQTHQSNNMLVHNVEKVLLQKLNDCDNQTSSPSSSSLASCQEVLLRCLGNMGFTNSVSKIMEVVESSEVAAVSETGLKALRHVDDTEIEKLKERLKNIFQQKVKKYELPARSEAFQLLLRTDLTEEDVEDIYAVSLDPSNQEFGSFIQSKLVDASKSDERIRNVIRKVQKNNVLNNYDTMSRKGSSLFFSSSFLDSPPITYSMYVENGKSHIVRRSGMSVDLHLTEEPDLYFPTSREPDDIYQQQREIKHRFKKNLQFYKFELFATGMEALLGEKQEDDNNNEHKIKEPMSGLSLDIMGVSNRPTIFFKSQGELMSALWNAPSELTSAFQVNILLHDHHQRIQLENGMTVNLVVIGSLSLDLSGSLLYSIWNKNAQSLIRNTVSYSLDTELELVDTKDTIKLNRRQDIQTALDFMTDVNFSDATEMCLTMFTSSAPDLRYEINTYECLDGCKKPFKTSYKRAVTYQPQCYALPPKNYQLCNSMFYSSQ